MTKRVLSVGDVREILRLECEKAGGQKAWATQRGLSNAYVSEVVNGRKDAGDGIASHLGLVKFVAYRAIGA